MGVVCIKAQMDTLRSPSQQMQMLKKILKKELQESQYKDVCIRNLEKYYHYSSQLRRQQPLRKSILNTYLEESRDIFKSDTELNEARPNLTTSSQTVPKGNQYVLGLIAQSYLFLDLSDCVDNREPFDKFMKHQLTKGNPSLDQSFAQNRKAIIARLQNQLKDLKASTVSQLQNYVKFCRKVKYDLQLSNRQFLSRIRLKLEDKFIEKYVHKQFSKDTALLKEMGSDMKVIIQILCVVTEVMMEVNREQRQDFKQDNQFLNQVNLYTMITSIIFQQAQLTAFIVNKIKRCFHKRLNYYNHHNAYTKRQFIQDLVHIFHPNTNIEHDFKEIHIFQRSAKFLSKVFKKSVPIFKLKVIFELSRQIWKDLCQLRTLLFEKYSIQLGKVFTRQTELLAIRWLLKSNAEILDDICAHVLFTYQFVDQMHLLDQKGSCLISFLQSIEHIIKWSPN